MIEVPQQSPVEQPAQLAPAVAEQQQVEEMEVAAWLTH